MLTGCRKGAVPRALVRDGPRAAARELRQLIELFGRDRVLVELWDHGDPLDIVAQRRARRAGRCATTCPAWRRTTCTTPSPAQRRLATAVAAVRARRSLDELDPWLPAATTAHLRSGAEQARRFLRYPGVVDLAAEIGRAAAFDLSLVAPKLPPFPCPGPDGRRSARCSTCARSSTTARCDRYGERPPPYEDLSKRARAWRTIDHELAVIEGARLRRLLPRGVGDRPVLQARPTSSARVGGARRTVPSATRSASPTPTRWSSACCSSGSSRRSVTARRTSTSTSRATGARRSSSTSTRATAATTPPRWPTSSPTGRSRRCATWPRRSASPPASRTRGASSSTRGATLTSPANQPGGGGPRHPARTSSSWPRRSRTRRATSASTRAGWSSATGRWSRCARWSGRGWTSAACCSGTRTTARPPGWSSSTCSAWGCSPPCTCASTWCASTAATRSTWPGCRRRTRCTRCCAGPTPSACSRSRAGRRWPRCRGCGRASSTTSSSRSRSSAPARSRAARCTRTSAGATARSR